MWWKALASLALVVALGGLIVADAGARRPAVAVDHAHSYLPDAQVDEARLEAALKP